MTKTTEPQFDFSKVNYRWDKQWMRINSQFASASVMASKNVELNDDAQPTDQARLNLAQIEALNQLTALQDQRDEMLVQTIVSVPRDWLDDDAPADLDWNDVDSLGWLKNGTEGINELIKAMATAKQAKAKN